MDKFKTAKLFDAGGDLSQRWFVYYHFLSPDTGKYCRFRHWVPQKILTASGRRDKAHEIIKSINTRLRQGFNPYAHTERKYTSLAVAIAYVLSLKENSCRKRTHHTYSSMVQKFNDWLISKNLLNLAVDDFNYHHAQEFMDYTKAILKNSNRTYNNRVTAMKTLFKVLVKREWILINPFDKIDMLPEEDPSVIVFTIDDQIKIPSIKDIIGVGLVGDFIHGIHVMNLSFRNIKESGYLSNNIIEGMYLNATFGLAKMGPPEKANTQIDGRRIESVETARNYKFFHNALTLCDRYHLVGKLFKNLVISVCVGLGKVAARYCSLAKSKMVGLGLVCGNDADELSKAFATCKLTKYHNQQLIPTTQRFDVFITLVSHNDAIKNSFRQKLNKLTENKFSLVHNTRYLFGYYDTNSNRHVDYLYV